MSRPVFGVDRDAAIVRGDRNRDGSLKHNPMLLHGPGPADKRCRDCAHLLGYKLAGSWFKCDLREHSNSTRTDHRALWPTCAKFEATA